MEVIKIKYFDKDIDKLEKISIGDWIDLRSAIDIDLKAGEYKAIPLGVGMILPKGYEAHIVPRSSTYKNFGVISANCTGVIDNSYQGDNDQWHMPVYCIFGKDRLCDDDGVTVSHGTYIHRGDKIAQFRIMEIQPEIEFEEVEHLGNADRNGFGSTGTR